MGLVSIERYTSPKLQRQAIFFKDIYFEFLILGRHHNGLVLHHPIPGTLVLLTNRPTRPFFQFAFISCRSDVSAKDAANGEFELSVTCLVNKILCGEEIFGPGMK